MDTHTKNTAQDLAAYVKRWWVWARDGVMESSEDDVEKILVSIGLRVGSLWGNDS